MSPSQMSLYLLCPKALGKVRPCFQSPSCCHISLPYIMVSDIKVTHQRVQTTFSHASHWHHVIIAMLTLCYFITTHATLILYCHACMLTLQISLTSCVLWLPHV